MEKQVNKGGYQHEVPIFASGGVEVTSKRFVCYQQTYPLSGITAYSPFFVPASVGVPATLGVLFGIGAVGAVMLIKEARGDTGPFWVVLLVLIALCTVCVFWVRSMKPSYGVQISTAGLQVKAVVTADQAFQQAIIDALNEAVAMR